MANNCLVTKYKAATNNSNLEKLGILDIFGTGNADIGFKGSSPITVKCVSGTMYSDQARTQAITEKIIPVSANTSYMYIVSGTHIEVSSKYNITFVYTTPATEMMDTKDFKYSTGITRLTVPQIKGKLSDLSGLTSCTTLELVGNSAPYNFVLEGTAADIAGLTALTKINLMRAQEVDGSFESLGKCTALTDIKIAETHIGGTVEAFVARQRGAGRTTASNIAIALALTTFNGSPVTHNSTTLSWTATTITFNGVTIDNSDVNPN
jgi:hypothetical protein